MPGKRITDHQVHKYKQHRNKLSQVASAAKAGISERSARRVEGAQSLPSQRPARSWRTREDPLSAVWDSEVIPLLQTDARLNAVTLLEELQRRYPGQWDASVLRTLQPERVNDFATPFFMNLRCRVVLFQSASFALAVG